MPRLWNDTIEAHRESVREAVLTATAHMVAEQGLTSVTMSQIAERAGIGRATLYKYFPDVDTILLAWHERQVTTHLADLVRVRDRARPGGRLEAVLDAYAGIAYEAGRHHGGDVAALLHQGRQVARAQWHLLHFVRDLVAEAAAAGTIRDDVAPDELARYCVHALGAARTLRSKGAVRRLVAVTLAGLRPRH